MRVIKFRGKSVFNGIWRIGYLSIGTDTSELVIDDPDTLLVCTVDPETVGEFIGLKDKKLNEMYEGDLFRYDGYPNHVMVVESIGSMFMWRNAKDNSKLAYNIFNLSEIQENKEVIGNIYDNPDLTR
jgi:uncharacterized phage protein (TIGR01671 family)